MSTELNTFKPGSCSPKFPSTTHACIVFFWWLVCCTKTIMFQFQHPCITMKKYNKNFRATRGSPLQEWYPDSRKWPVKDLQQGLLCVHFMNECPHDWKFDGKPITCRIIMELVKHAWGDRFVIMTQEYTHIRVEFQGNFVKLSYWHQPLCGWRETIYEPLRFLASSPGLPAISQLMKLTIKKKISERIVHERSFQWGEYMPRW